MGSSSGKPGGGDDVFHSRDRVVVTGGAFAGLAGVVVTEVVVGGPGWVRRTCRVRLRLWRAELTVELPTEWVRAAE